MRIALINENSQADKNQQVYEALVKIAKPLGHEVYNFGMYTSKDKNQMTYVMNGVLAAVLLNAKAVDMVVTGCGTGEGAMLALNSFPGVFCGLVIDPADAYMFSQINAGNAISLPLAKGFGWGADLNLEYIFEKYFSEEPGNGYPRERAVPMRENREILKVVKSKTTRDMISILKDLDQKFVLDSLSGPRFTQYFFKLARDKSLASFIKELLNDHKD